MQFRNFFMLTQLYVEFPNQKPIITKFLNELSLSEKLNFSAEYHQNFLFSRHFLFHFHTPVASKFKVSILFNTVIVLLNFSIC